MTASRERHDDAGNGAGQRVDLERYGTKVIGHRRWSFKEGRAYYRIADERNKVASGWIPEERLKQMVENARQMDRTTEAERQNDLEASL